MNSVLRDQVAATLDPLYFQPRRSGDSVPFEKFRRQEARDRAQAAFEAIGLTVEGGEADGEGR